MAKERADVLETVRKLLDRADGTTFTAEAEACRKKADDLMLVYTIEHYELERDKPKDQREKPELRRFDVCPNDSVIKQQLVDLAGAVVRHVRGQHVLHNWNSKFGLVSVGVVAYPTDLDYFEMLFLSLRLQMVNNLEPKPDPNLSELENMVMLKEAGLTWVRIHEIMEPGVPWNRARHGTRNTNRYTQYCKDNNRERIYSAPLTYTRNFASAFVERVEARFTNIRDAQHREQTGGSGMELVLRDRSQDIKDLYKELFPKLAMVKATSGSKFDAAAQRRGAAAGDRADLGQNRVSRRKEIG